MKKAGLLVPALLFFPLEFALAISPEEARAQGTVTFGGSASGQAAPTTGAKASAQGAGTAEPAEPDWTTRDRQLNEGSVLTGGVGLLHTQHAQGGAPGQFRLSFTTEFFSSGFMCSREFPCPDPRSTTTQIIGDANDHFGGRLNLSVQVLKWLEPYLATSASANSNPANRPQLLQVLGDTTLGAKAHGKLSNIFYAGGAFELWLVNGTGAVGLDGGGTSARFRGLGTADLRGAEKPLPLRFSLNADYVLDNSGEVVVPTEKARGTSITRIERYGLNINRVDHVDFRLGGEFFALEEKIRPFIEYQVLIPVNRQNYLCKPNNPSGDKCLANEAIGPSSLTLGARFFPWKGGFNLTAALDIGLTGVGNFIEEVRPTPPWMLYLGGGWAFDTVDRPPSERIVEKLVLASEGRKIRGLVHEEGKTDAVAGAIVTWDNHPDMTGMVSGADGRFATPDVPEGLYVFNVRADGYKSAQCSATVAKAQPTAPAVPRKGAPAAPPPPPAQVASVVTVDCALAPLPRVGNIVGHVKDLESGQPVANATIKIVDAVKKEVGGATDASGTFRFELLTPGDAQITADAEGYMTSTEKAEIKVRQDNTIEIGLKKRGKPMVTVSKTEIIIKQQIQFAVDSAVILPESSGLLTEIADVLVKNPRIKRVEVQGHTDNTGTEGHNKQLSEDRANSVVAWLASHGVNADRMTGKGYGQSKPLVPNVTANNRQKNRRVQFIITDQDPGNTK